MSEKSCPFEEMFWTTFSKQNVDSVFYFKIFHAILLKKKKKKKKKEILSSADNSAHEQKQKHTLLYFTNLPYFLFT